MWKGYRIWISYVPIAATYLWNFHADHYPYMAVSWDGGTPSRHPFDVRMVHLSNHPAIGCPHDGNLHIVMSRTPRPLGGSSWITVERMAFNRSLNQWPSGFFPALGIPKSMKWSFRNEHGWSWPSLGCNGWPMIWWAFFSSFFLCIFSGFFNPPGLVLVFSLQMGIYSLFVAEIHFFFHGPIDRFASMVGQWVDLAGPSAKMLPGSHSNSLRTGKSPQWDMFQFAKCKKNWRINSWISHDYPITPIEMVVSLLMFL